MPTIEVYASEEAPVLDGSYLTHDKESTGYDTKITRGEYLLVGYSKCVVAGEGKIYVGGSTVATQTVNEVGIGVMVERAQKGDDHWDCIDSWKKINKNADRVASSKLLEVEGGYYYRVRSIHSAGGDISDSFTDGVYVE